MSFLKQRFDPRYADTDKNLCKNVSWRSGKDEFEFKYEFTTGQVTLPNGEVYKFCDVCGEKCKSNMGIKMRFRTVGQCGFIVKGFCHKCSKKYEKLIDEFFHKLADKGGANG